MSNPLIENYEKFKKVRAIFYKKYNIKLESAYDKITGIDLSKIESLVDQRILSSNLFSEMKLTEKKLNCMSVKKKCELLFEKDDIEFLKELF